MMSKEMDENSMQKEENCDQYCQTRKSTHTCKGSIESTRKLVGVYENLKTRKFLFERKRQEEKMNKKSYKVSYKTIEVKSNWSTIIRRTLP